MLSWQVVDKLKIDKLMMLKLTSWSKVTSWWKVDVKWQVDQIIIFFRDVVWSGGDDGRWDEIRWDGGWYMI